MAEPVVKAETIWIKSSRPHGHVAAALDGFDVLRTSVEGGKMSAETVVAAYKSLSHVERAFRSLRSMQLRERPIYHRLADRVRAHLFIAMLAYYVEWHLRRAWSGLLAGAGELGPSLRELFSELALVTRNRMRTAGGCEFTLETNPTPRQAEALALARKITPGAANVDKP